MKLNISSDDKNNEEIVAKEVLIIRRHLKYGMAETRQQHLKNSCLQRSLVLMVVLFK